MTRELNKKRGRVPNSFIYLLDIRNSYIIHLSKSLKKNEIAFIFNLNASQITRIINKKQ